MYFLLPYSIDTVSTVSKLNSFQHIQFLAVLNTEIAKAVKPFPYGEKGLANYRNQYPCCWWKGPRHHVYIYTTHGCQIFFYQIVFYTMYFVLPYYIDTVSTVSKLNSFQHIQFLAVLNTEIA